MQNLPTSLPDWLAMLETRHSETQINMGLDRVQAVKARMQLAFSCPVIMVAGTNGKGSTCAMLESVLLRAGYKVGLYIKPHFLDFNERARVNGELATDAMLVAAFDFVEQKRGEVDLTYFEFTTLAIMHLLAGSKLDVAILEVGLGGRLDAVNVIDADVAIVTSVDIDHTDYLGDTREKIGFEKAGIFRPGKAAICSDPVPPASLIRNTRVSPTVEGPSALLRPAVPSLARIDATERTLTVLAPMPMICAPRSTPPASAGVPSKLSVTYKRPAESSASRKPKPALDPDE